MAKPLVKVLTRGTNMKLSSMVRFGGLVLGATSWAGGALASDPGTEFTVKYSTAAAAVPLSPWMMLGLGVAIAGATALVLHKRGMGQALALALAGTLGLSALGVAQNAYAVPTPALRLELSGGGLQSITLNDVYVDVTVANVTSGAVTITEMVMPTYYFYPSDPGRVTTCEVGKVLLAGETCTAAFTQFD